MKKTLGRNSCPYKIPSLNNNNNNNTIKKLRLINIIGLRGLDPKVMCLLTRYIKRVIQYKMN